MYQIDFSHEPAVIVGTFEDAAALAELILPIPPGHDGRWVNPTTFVIVDKDDLVVHSATIVELNGK